MNNKDIELSEEGGKKLLKLARGSIKEEFTGEEPSMPQGRQFDQKKGVFVSIYKSGEVRGCIGIPYPTFPLKKAVARAAKSAAFKDPRFDELEKEDLDDITIEISTLTMPKECEPENIEIGKHGLICSYKSYSGLLLPQVAENHDMDKDEFIKAVCRKANLPESAREEEECKFWRFKCQIFSERSLGESKSSRDSEKSQESKDNSDSKKGPEDSKGDKESEN